MDEDPSMSEESTVGIDPTWSQVDISRFEDKDPFNIKGRLAHFHGSNIKQVSVLWAPVKMGVALGTESEYTRMFEGLK